MKCYLIILLTQIVFCAVKSKAPSSRNPWITGASKINCSSGNHTSKPCRSVVSFVNGIYHSYSDLQKIGVQLEDIFNEEVRVFYNPSTGNWFSDAYRAGVELIYKPNDLLIAKSLALHLRRALKDVGTDGRVLHLAHSGGAIMTYLAARYHLTPNETSRIDIATFGGGRSITRKYFTGGRIVNYYSHNDPLLLVDKRASLLSKLLNSSTTRRMVTGDRNTTYNEIRDIKHNTTFVFLDGLLNNPIRDHDMEGPTYSLALRLEAMEHKKRMRRLSTSREMQKYWIRLGRKRTAELTGLHHFWDNLPDTVRNFRKKSARLTNIHSFFNFNLTMPSISYFNISFPQMAIFESSSALSPPTVPSPLTVPAIGWVTVPDGNTSSVDRNATATVAGSEITAAVEGNVVEELIKAVDSISTLSVSNFLSWFS